MHHAIESGVGDAACDALGMQVRCIDVAVGRGPRGLQEREQVLDAVVGRVGAADQVGQQQLVLSQRGDDAILRDGASPLSVVRSLSRATATLARVSVPAIG